MNVYHLKKSIHIKLNVSNRFQRTIALTIKK